MTVMVSIPNSVKKLSFKLYKELHWSGVIRILHATILPISMATFHYLRHPVFDGVGVISFLLALVSLGFIVWIPFRFSKTIS